MSDKKEMEDEVESLFEQIDHLNAKIDIKFSRIDSLKYEIAKLQANLIEDR